MIKALIGGILGIGTLLGSWFGINQAQPPVVANDYIPTFGSYSPTGGGTYRLGQSIGTTDTTIKLSSFKEPVSNIPYTMSYLNSDIEYGTLSPQSSISEFISFSGITQNSDGSATLTGVVRGMSRTPGTGGCVASTTLAQGHAGQSIFILSNPPCQLAEYVPLRTTATSSAVLVFSSTTPPRLDYTAAQATGSYISTTSEFATVAYVNATTVAGANNSSESVKGISQLSTATQAGNSTSQGSTGARLVLPGSLATSSCVIIQSSIIAASSTTGKIDPGCIGGSTAIYSFTATTSISATGTSTNPLKLNGIGYAFPGTQGASSTVLATDGNGFLSWQGAVQKLYLNTNPTSVTQTTATTTVFSFSVPGNTLSTSNYVKVHMMIRGWRYDAGVGDYQIDVGYGGASTTMTFFNSNFGVDGSGYADIYLAATGATNSQKMSTLIQVNATSTPQINSASSTAFEVSKSMAVDSTQAQNIVFQVHSNSATAGAYFVPDMVTAEIYR